MPAPPLRGGWARGAPGALTLTALAPQLFRDLVVRSFCVSRFTVINKKAQNCSLPLCLVSLLTRKKRKQILPHPRGTPGGKPQRLTARAKIARARPDRFWPGEALFDLSVCPSVCLSVVPERRPKFGSKSARFAPSNDGIPNFSTGR